MKIFERLRKRNREIEREECFCGSVTVSAALLRVHTPAAAAKSNSGGSAFHRYPTCSWSRLRGPEEKSRKNKNDRFKSRHAESCSSTRQALASLLHTQKNLRTELCSRDDGKVENSDVCEREMCWNGEVLVHRQTKMVASGQHLMHFKPLAATFFTAFVAGDAAVLFPIISSLEKQHFYQIPSTNRHILLIVTWPLVDGLSGTGKALRFGRTTFPSSSKILHPRHQLRACVNIKTHKLTFLAMRRTSCLDETCITKQHERCCS